MLHSLRIRNFTVFKDVDFQFSPGLNVILGDNGTGKTHVLKLGYLFSRAWSDLTSKRTMITTQRAESYLEERLLGLFRVSELSALVQHDSKADARLSVNIGGHIPTLQVRMPNEPASNSVGLHETMAWQVQIQRHKDLPDNLKAKMIPDQAASNAFLPSQVFIPSKEIVSLFKGLIGLFDRYQEFPLDETYRDLAVAMATLEPRKPSSLFTDAAQHVQELLGGDLKLESGDLFFERIDGSRLESQLMAEGHRKLALLVYLLRYGVIERNSTVFWDEPEANLNPASLKFLAKSLFILSKLGVQVVLATHSLFLLREFEILRLEDTAENTPPVRFFGMGKKGGRLQLTQGESIADIEPLHLLDENLNQSDRYMEVSQ